MRLVAGLETYPCEVGGRLGNLSTCVRLVAWLVIDLCEVGGMVANLPM